MTNRKNKRKFHGKNQTRATKVDVESDDFAKLKSKTLSMCKTLRKRVQELEEFIELHLNINQQNGYINRTESMCLYFEKLSDTFLEIGSRLNRLDQHHIQSIKENAKKVQTLMETGKRLIDSKKYLQAIDEYAEAEQIKSSNDSIFIELLSNRAFANSKIGNFQEAISICTRAISINRDQLKVRVLRAQCYDNVDNFRNSIIDYETAMDLAHEMNDEEMKSKIRTVLNKVIIKHDHQIAVETSAKGDDQFQLGNYSRAASFYSGAISLWPEKISFHEHRCKCYIRIAAYKRALEDCQFIVKYEPDSRKGYDLMSISCLNLGAYEQADEAIESMAKNGCDKSICEQRKLLCTQLIEHQTHIDCCLDENRFSDAIIGIDRAMELLPSSNMLRILKAECAMHLSDTKEINKIEVQWISMDADRLYLQGLSSCSDGNLVEALQYLEDALKTDQNHDKAKQMHSKVNTLYKKKLDGDNFLGREEYDGAAACYTEALDINISNNNTFVFEILRSRARANSKIGFLHDAIYDCDRALAIKKNDIKTLLLRAECHQLLDNFAQAMEDFELILALGVIRDNSQKFKEIRSKIHRAKVEMQHDEARNKKISGDNFFKDSMYAIAMSRYAKAIELWPENVSFYEAFIECCMITERYKKAIKECQAALAIDNTFIKGYHFMIECFLKFGNLTGAERAIKKCEEHGSKDDQTMIKLNRQCAILKETKAHAMEAFAKGNFNTTLFKVEKALEIAHESTELKLFKAECLVSLERHEEANIIAVSCMQSDPSNADAVYVRALCLYQKDCGQGLECLKNVIRLDPDHKKAKEMIAKWKKFQESQRLADELLQNGRYREASDHFSVALKISPKNSVSIPKLLFNRAFANSKLGVSFIRNAISDCSRLMTTGWSSSKASVLKLRAKCHMQMRNFQRSVEDYEQLVLLDNSTEIKEMLEEAKKALKRFQSNDHYDVLDLEKHASQSDIKKAYKRLALIHHPDKHSDAPNDERLEQQEIFKRITAAHDVLSNQRKRAEYDRNDQDN